jgi:hypothetical protein
MEKNDTLFLKVINDERLVANFDIVPSKYSCLEDGKKALHPQVRAIAEILSQMSKRVNEAKMDLRIRNKIGEVVLDEADFQPIYKKVVSLLTK